MILFADAAYIATWMIDYCNLIGRKVVFETSETCFWGCFTLFFSMNQNHGEILYPQWSSPIFYSATKVQNSVMFSPIMSTKCNRFSWILFADQKRNIQLKPFFFSSPLFDLTLLPVYIITVIKVKLRVESYLFLLASKID